MSPMTTTTAQMVATARGWTVTIPAGTYFLGDPCYVVPDEDWMPLLESCRYFGLSDPDLPGVPSPVGTTPSGIQVVAFSTAYGDGTYVDQRGWEYSVDAGLIGLTPETIRFKNDYAPEVLDRLGRLVTFDQDTTATTDGEGRMTFGQFTINTADDEGGDYR